MRVAIFGILVCAVLGCGPEFKSEGDGGSAGDSAGGNAMTGDGGDSPITTAGKSASDTCPITPCGGNVVGTWQISSVCADFRVDPSTNGSCKTASSINNVQMSGTYTYGADGSFAWDTKTGGTTTVTLPAECIAGIPTCASLEGEFTLENGYDSGSCSGKPTTSCTCTAKLTEQPSSGTGTYKTAGNTLTAILGSDSSTSAYCVKGSRLTTQYENSTSHIVTTIVATKL